MKASHIALVLLAFTAFWFWLDPARSFFTKTANSTPTPALSAELDHVEFSKKDAAPTASEPGTLVTGNFTLTVSDEVAPQVLSGQEAQLADEAAAAQHEKFLKEQMRAKTASNLNPADTKKTKTTK